MKQVWILILAFFFAQDMSGQSEIAESNKIQRSNILQLSTLVGSSKVGFGMRYKSVYNVKESIKIGWGVGIDSYSSGLERNFIPVSLEFIGDIFESKRTPFYMLSAGYGIPLQEDEEFAKESMAGLMIDISLGYRSRKNNSQPFVAFGYRMQHASYLGDDAYGNDNKDVVYKRWSLTAGLLF